MYSYHGESHIYKKVAHTRNNPNVRLLHIKKLRANYPTVTY